MGNNKIPRHSMFKSPLYCTLGIIIISWTSYRLFFLVRKGYEINNQVTSFMLGLVTILWLIQLGTIYLLIKQIINRKPQEKIFIKKILNILYYKPLYTIGQILLKNKFMTFIINIISNIYELTIRHKNQVILLTIIFCVIPKLAIGLVLLIDVFYFQQINLFYKSIWFFAYPIGFRVLLSLIEIHITKSKNELEDSFPKLKKINLFEPIEQSNYVPTKILRHWIYYINILDIHNAFNIYQQTRMYLVFSIITTCTFLVAWSHYLYIVFIYIFIEISNFYLLWYLKLLKILLLSL